jgi:hypothetical protein
VTRADSNVTAALILAGEYTRPSSMEGTTWSLVQGLLTQDPEQRLGISSSSTSDYSAVPEWSTVKAHPFFAGTDWDATLSKNITPPYAPDSIEESIVANFSTRYTAKMGVWGKDETALQQQQHYGTSSSSSSKKDLFVEELKGFEYVQAPPDAPAVVPLQQQQ